MFFSPKSTAFNPGLLRTDVHNHILPGVDDGLDTDEEAIDLLAKMHEAGFETIVLTPHIYREMFPNSADSLREKWRDFRPKAEEEFPGLRLELGAEYHFDEHFERIVEDKEELLSFRNDVCLIEFPLLEEPPRWRDVFFDLQTRGYQVVLAHVERYGFFNRSQWEDLQHRNVLIQVNLLSLSGAYGVDLKARAQKLLDGGFVDLWGTDIHSGEHWKLFEQFEVPNSIGETLENTKWLNQRWNHFDNQG